MKKDVIMSIALTIVLLLVTSFQALGCSPFLVGKNASVDGSTIITVSQDQPEYDWRLEYIPAKDHKPGEMRIVYDYPQKFRWWDEYGNPLNPKAPEHIVAKIPEVPHTYGYIRRMFGVMNEHQLSIGMATMSHQKLREELWNDEAKIRATELSYIAMERARTAREAIKIIGSITEELGFKGEYVPGKTLCIGDPNEVWVMHIVGPGPFWTPGCGEPGAIWVAQRVPDDHVALVANGISIGVVDFDDPDNFMYSSNLKSFAIEMGWYDPKSGVPFNFREVYAEPGPSGWSVAVRKWRAYSLLAPSQHFPDPDERLKIKGPYGWPYRYPFSIKPDKKVSVADLMRLYRDRLEGTKYDLTKGPLAGPFGSPHRTLGTKIKLDGKMVHEGRGLDGDGTTYTQICKMRGWLPDPIGGIVWWAPGHPTASYYVPFYAGITKLPDEYTKGNKVKMEWGKSAYWAATFVYTFADVMYCHIIKDVKEKQAEIEGEAFAMIPAIDKAALEIYRSDPEKAREFLTQWCNQFARDATKRYWDFANYLIVKYANGYINRPKLAQHPEIPDKKYWVEEALKYQKEVRGRPIDAKYYTDVGF